MNFNFAAFTESLVYGTHQQKNPDCRPRVSKQLLPSHIAQMRLFAT